MSLIPRSGRLGSGDRATMRVLAVVMGSQGDLLPFVHLGGALGARGHETVIAGFDEFAETIAGRQIQGVGDVSLPGDCQEMMKRLLGDSEGMLDAVRGVRQMLGDPAIFEALEGAMAGVDVVMHNQFGEVARLLGASRGVPSVRVQVYPTEPCRSYSLVDPRNLDGTRRAVLIHRLSNAMMTWAMGPVMKTWRRRLGLGRGVLRGSPQTIYQFSPGLNPPDPAWRPHVHVTGEWLSPDPAPPLREDVEDFLQRGEAPLLVSFGSVASDRLRDLWRWTREVLVEQGLRAIIVDPDQGSGESDGLLTVDRVPFTVVLPRCRAVLCQQDAVVVADAADVVTGLAVGRYAAILAYCVRPGVVGSKRRFERAKGVNLALKVGSATEEIGIGIVILCRTETELTCGTRHQLHQPHGPFGRTGTDLVA